MTRDLQTQCDVQRDQCTNPATHHTMYGRHLCDDHWMQRQVVARVRRQIRVDRAWANIARIGKGL